MLRNVLKHIFAHEVSNLKNFKESLIFPNCGSWTNNLTSSALSPQLRSSEHFLFKKYYLLSF